MKSKALAIEQNHFSLQQDKGLATMDNAIVNKRVQHHCCGVYLHYARERNFLGCC